MMERIEGMLQDTGFRGLIFVGRIENVYVFENSLLQKVIVHDHLNGNATVYYKGEGDECKL